MYNAGDLEHHPHVSSVVNVKMHTPKPHCLPSLKCVLVGVLNSSSLKGTKIRQNYRQLTLSPFPKRQILDSSKLKEFADDNFKFNENGRKFFKRVENTGGKGEIACHEQFLLFPQCFKRLVLQTYKNQGLSGKGLINFLPNEKLLDWSKLKAFADDKKSVNEKLEFVLGREENMGKGENAGYQHFLLFPQCFQKASFFNVVKSRDCVVKS